MKATNTVPEINIINEFWEYISENLEDGEYTLEHIKCSFKSFVLKNDEVDYNLYNTMEALMIKASPYQLKKINKGDTGYKAFIKNDGKYPLKNIWSFKGDVDKITSFDEPVTEEFKKLYKEEFGTEYIELTKEEKESLCKISDELGKIIKESIGIDTKELYLDKEVSKFAPSSISDTVFFTMVLDDRMSKTQKFIKKLDKLIVKSFNDGLDADMIKKVLENTKINYDLQTDEFNLDHTKYN